MGNTPEIRFKGYTDDWEQRKLEDVVIDHNAGIYISKEDYGKGTNVIGVGNIYDSDIFDGEIYRLGPVNDDKFILEENDIIYGESSLVPEGIARTVCIGKNGAGSAFAWHTRRVKLDKNVVNSHVVTLELNYLHDIRKYLVSVSTQTALTGMTTDGYFGATLTLPSIQEQQKISDYFKQLDHLITLHQRKCDETKELKKYMLQKMFPKNGEKKPEIRFEGFTDDWEQRKLGEVAQEFKSGNSLKADEIDITGEYPVYGGNGLRGYTSTYNHEGEYALIGRQGALCGNMNYSVGKAYFTEHAVVVKADENNDTRFLYYMLDTMNLGQYSDQSAQPGLAVNKLVKLVDCFPTKEEQQRIGWYFSNIDHLITLHQRKLEELQTMKKFMLSKMFV